VDGTIHNRGGTVSPGLSPGTLTVHGSYEQTADGRLLMEIGGTNTADCDRLIVTNSATLNGHVTFRFINGFAPKAGQHFDFLSVGGTRSNTFATVALQNLAPGFQFNLETNGPVTRMTALNDGVFSSTLPGQVTLTVTNIGGITYASYVITTSNTCQSISLDGQLTRTNNQFSQGFQGTTMVAGGDCASKIATVTGMLILGALPPGTYSLNLTSAGQSFDTVPFTVVPDPGKTLLSPTLLADGSLQFQIDGLSPVSYSVEASEDLRYWTTIYSGTLPDTFTDPDAAIFPTRYYRARIEP
jgi:hypothetical protein